LRERGIEVLAVLPDEPGNAADRLRDGGVPVAQIPLSRMRASMDARIQAGSLMSFRRDVRTLRGLFRAHGIRVVVVGGLINTQAALAARLEGLGLVWQVVDTRTPMAARRALIPLVDALADVVMFGGQRLIALHPGALRLKSEVIVLEPSVDLDRFRPSKELGIATRRALSIPEQSPLVGTVANLNPQKGIEFFVQAAARIRERMPEAHFVVVGALDPNHREYQARVQSDARAAELTDRIHFTDARPDVERYYPAMDVKLVTSVPHSEGTTTTAIEAMACGVPVAAADVGAVRDVVEDEVTGRLVPPCDPVAMADSTLELLQEPERANRLVVAARRRVLERHGLDRAAELQAAALGSAADRSKERLRRS
jgi:glycosyltransferase involved in cell wall biosynthesis